MGGWLVELREGGGGRGRERSPRVALAIRQARTPSRHLSPLLTWMLRVANSTPMVDLDSSENSLRVKRLRRLDLPTPLSPIRTTLNR